MQLKQDGYSMTKRIKVKSKYAFSKSTEDSVGYDVRSAERVVIKGNQTHVVSTGLFLKMPKTWEAQIRSRSGIAAKYSIHVLNAPATIDPDYTGEIKVILHNSSPVNFEVYKGDRIAQIVFKEVPKVIIDVEGQSKSKPLRKRTRGLGSTGIK